MHLTNNVLERKSKTSSSLIINTVRGPQAKIKQVERTIVRTSTKKGRGFISGRKGTAWLFNNKNISLDGCTHAGMYACVAIEIPV